MTARAGHRLAADEASSLAAAALSTEAGAAPFPRGRFTGVGEGSRRFATGISSNAASLVRNQKSNAGRWKPFRSTVFLSRR